MGIYSSNFDFNKYRCFYAVAECKSFSKATELLHISQPAISRAVKDLENQLGKQLFIRESKSVKLTESGEKLMEYVQKAFNNIIMAERAITENKEEISGEIRIGIYSHISLIMLPNFIKCFTEKYPDVRFDILTISNIEAKEKLNSRELDFIILQYPIFIDEGIYTEEIVCELENCFFANKKYYDLFVNDTNDLVQYPLILPFRGYNDINSLEELFKQKKKVLETDLRVYALELRAKLAVEGLGIGWGLRKSVEEYFNNKTLYELPIEFACPTTKYSIAYDDRYLSKTSKIFLNEFKKYLKENF